FDYACFPDLSPGIWYTPSTCYAQEQEIVTGRPDGLFWPGDNINFAAAAKIVVKTLKVPVPAAPEEGFGEWYEEFIYALSEKKAIPPTITRADQLITRGEMAQITSLILNQKIDQAS